jgi:hypothetical protein
MGEISTDAARQRPRHPNKLPRQRHPSTATTSNHPPQHPTTTTTSNHHQHHPYHPHHHRIHPTCPAPDRSNAKPAAAVSRVKRQRNGRRQRRKRKRGRKAEKTRRQVTRRSRSPRGGLSMENKPAGAGKTGKKTSKPHPRSFSLRAHPRSYPPPLGKPRSSAPARTLRRTRQAHPNYLSKPPTRFFSKCVIYY